MPHKTGSWLLCSCDAVPLVLLQMFVQGWNKTCPSLGNLEQHQCCTLHGSSLPLGLQTSCSRYTQTFCTALPIANLVLPILSQLRDPSHLGAWHHAGDMDWQTWDAAASQCISLDLAAYSVLHCSGTMLPVGLWIDAWY